MSNRPSLHVIFTMNCLPAAPRRVPEGPNSWEQSLRAIDGYCTRLLNAGYAVTLFLEPHCADAHAPLMEELSDRGVELGLYIQPQALGSQAYLGHHDRDAQHTIVRLALEAFQDAVGARPVTCRPDLFSANDDTFPVLCELGFRQGSVSSPGRDLPRHAATWVGAEPDAHYANSSSRLRRGDLPFLEVPVTTDASQRRGGIAPDLAIENGTLEMWHRPLIEGQLRRMETHDVPFRVLCFVTQNRFAFHDRDNRLATTLQEIVRYLDSLEEQYDVNPVTIAGAHARFRESHAANGRGQV